jgi:hypothetical protein
MQDLLWQLKDIDSFTIWVTAAFAAAVFWFIREIVGTPVLALFSVPILMGGGILAPLIFRNHMITLSYDKDANVAAMSAIGVLAALVLIVTAKWTLMVFKERRVRQTKVNSPARLERPVH